MPRKTAAKDAEKPEKPEPEQAEQTEPEKPEPEQAEQTEKPKSRAKRGEVTVVVATAISGLRNGKPWPEVGERITLPAEEAESYLRFGYVREP